MTDYAALKTEIALPAYNGLNDTQIAAAINVKTVTTKENVVSQTAVNALIFTSAGDWGNVVAVAEGITTAGVNSATRIRCVSIKDLFTRNLTFEATDDTRWSRFLAAVDALVTAGFMSSEGRTALVALGRPVVLWPIVYGFPQGVNEGEIAAARLFNG